MIDELESAKFYLSVLKSREYPDPQLAVYNFRDLPETKAAGLDDLAWALDKGNCSYNDAIGFFEQLIKYLEQQHGEIMP